MTLKALFTTKRLNLMNIKEITVVIYNINIDIIVILILILKVKARVLIDFLDKITILIKYINYNNNFLPEFIINFFQYSNYNYVIKLKKSKKQIYSLINILKLIK